MNIEKNVVNETNCNVYDQPRICWSVIFVGAFVGLGLAFLLHLFGTAIGLSAYRSSSVSLPELAIGGILGLIISVIVSMGLAGFVAGYLGRFHSCHCHHGVIYGFVTWSMMLILSAVFVLPFTHYISAYTRQLSPTVISAKSIVVKDTNMMDNQSVTSVSKNEQSSTEKTVNSNATAKQLIGISWLVFILFFIGALSSCIGACYGMRCPKEVQHR